MNPIHSMIALSCRGCVADNPFTYEQRIELLQVIERFQNVKISNIFKFTKYLKQFEDKYKAFGGDVEMLESRIKNIRDTQYEAAIKLVPGLKIEKKEV